MPLKLEKLIPKRRNVEELLENAWMNLTEEEMESVGHPMDSRTHYDKENPHIWLLNLMRKPEYIAFTCKHLFNIDLELFQICVLRQMFTKTFIIFIATRGGSKSYLLGLYSLLRATFTQGSKVVIVAAGFRSAKFVFEYAEGIWQNAPIFQDLIGSTSNKNRPRHDVDKHLFKIGDSFIAALPLGMGDKIRGQRACVGGETVIETNKGKIKIRDFGNLINDETAKVLNGEGYFERPLYFITTDPIDTYEIELSDGYKFLCSEIHQVMTIDGFKLAKELNSDDVVPRYKLCLSVVSVRLLEEKQVLYDFTMPETHSFVGDGIVHHNTHLIAEEFASIPPEIYEKVVSGFASVSQNPVKESRRRSRIKKMKEIGLWGADNEAQELLFRKSNQQILSGTCSYEWNHFCRYWKNYKSVIENSDNLEKLKDSFEGKFDSNLNPKGFCVIRLPAKTLPDGFMDEENLARSRAMLHSSLYKMEFETIFISDSDGFFRRSLIEKCVVGRPGSPVIIDDEEIDFVAQLKGHQEGEFYLGCDPASLSDQFAIVIIERRGNHRRIVFSWTITSKRHKERIKLGLAQEEEFYTFCVKKIRELLKVFPCKAIALDSQGGGEAIREGLSLNKNAGPGELPIYETIKEGEEKPTDDLSGLHILEMINFAKADWVSFANHGLRKDFEDKVLLFPRFDPVTVALAIEEDKALGKGGEFDTYEDCVMEIEELKDELATIVHTQTGVSGRDRWDVPGSKATLGIQEKGRLRKDRYSALLMANAVARLADNQLPEREFNEFGGIAKLPDKKEDSQGQMWSAPEWFTNTDGWDAVGIIDKARKGVVGY